MEPFESGALNLESELAEIEGRLEALSERGFSSRDHEPNSMPLETPDTPLLSEAAARSSIDAPSEMHSSAGPPERTSQPSSSSTAARSSRSSRSVASSLARLHSSTASSWTIS